MQNVEFLARSSLSRVGAAPIAALFAYLQISSLSSRHSREVLTRFSSAQFASGSSKVTSCPWGGRDPGDEAKCCVFFSEPDSYSTAWLSSYTLQGYHFSSDVFSSLLSNVFADINSDWLDLSFWPYLVIWNSIVCYISLSFVPFFKLFWFGLLWIWNTFTNQLYSRHKCTWLFSVKEWLNTYTCIWQLMVHFGNWSHVLNHVIITTFSHFKWSGSYQSDN